jgi:hypothetical protein
LEEAMTTHVRALAERHPGTVVLGAVAAGAVAGWVGRGATRDGAHRHPTPRAYDGPHEVAPASPAQPVPAPERPASPHDATGEALDPDIEATPAPIPGDVRGGNVADQSLGKSVLRRGAM